MKVRFIRGSEKKRIEEELEENFGIEKLPFMLIETGSEKIRGFSGSLSKEEIAILARLTHIELLGIYLLKKENDELRISFDSAQLLKDKISKGVVELDEKHFNEWIRGNDLQIKSDKGTKVIKYKGDLYGSSKSNGEKLFNYVPKDRRLKK